jgi:hypothetical protein
VIAVMNLFSIKGEKLLDQLSDHCLLKKTSLYAATYIATGDGDWKQSLFALRRNTLVIIVKTGGTYIFHWASKVYMNTKQKWLGKTIVQVLATLLSRSPLNMSL